LISKWCVYKCKKIHEKVLLQKWFEEMAMDTGRYCFMIKDTLEALEAGAVETLMVWDELEMDR
jgi:peptide chain release factor subunit 1